jgi:hypothetical protein
MRAFKCLIICAAVLTMEAAAIEIQGWDASASLDLQPFDVQTAIVPLKTIFWAKPDTAAAIALNKIDIKTVAKPLKTIYFCRYDNFLLIDLLPLIR